MGVLLFLLFTLLGIGVIVVSVFRSRPEYGESPKIKWLPGLFCIPLFILAFLSTGFVQIEAGHVGVVRQLGRVTGEVMQPGLAYRFPIFTSVDDVDTRVRSIRIENYTAASKEQQDLFLNLTLNYHIDPLQAPNIIQNVGSDFEAKIVQPRLLDIPKSVTDDYPTQIVLNSRDEIRDKATNLLREALAPYGFVVDNIAFENFSYSAEYNQSIEEKQIAQQQVETEKQRLAQAEIAAQTVTAQAKGQADAQIERARGEAEANRLVNASLTQQILINRYIEKLAPGIKTVLVPSDNGLILDLGKELTGETPSP